MNKKIFFILAIALIIFVVVLALIFLIASQKDENKKSVDADSDNSLANLNYAPIDPQVTRDGYASQVNRILAEYKKDQNPTTAKSGLLDLTVPVEYKDLHLQLVIGFSLIEEGKDLSDIEKIEGGNVKIIEGVNLHQEINY